MEVVVTPGAIGRAKLQSNHHHQQTNIQFFVQAGCPSCRPTNSVKALKGKYHIPWTCLLQTHMVVFKHCHWPLLVTLGEVCHASRQPSDASIPGVYCLKQIIWDDYLGFLSASCLQAFSQNLKGNCLLCSKTAEYSWGTVTTIVAAITLSWTHLEPLLYASYSVICHLNLFLSDTKPSLTSCMRAAATICTAPFLPCGRLSTSRGWADGNVAAVSCGQHVPTTAAA